MLSKRGLGIAGVVLAASGLAVGFHDALAGTLVRTVAAGAGYHLAYGRFHADLRSATLIAPRITNGRGEPVFAADRLDVRYSLRDLLPGSTRRFGLVALDVARPQLTLVHYPDGTYNVALPAANAAQKPDTTPLDVRARLRDGSVLLVDRFTDPRHERRQRIVGIAADVVLAPHVHSFYDVRFDVDDGHALHPVLGKATFATDRGFEAQRWTAASLPIGPLVDFALPSHAMNLVDGTLRGLDARIYTIVDGAGGTHTNVAAQAMLDGGKLYVAGIEKPLRDAHGRLSVYDDGITTTGIDATLAGVPLHLAGGVFDRAAPKVAFVVTGSGPLDRLRSIAAASAGQPLAGDLRFDLRATGSLAEPLVTGSFSSPSLAYRAFRFDRPAGTIAFRGRDLEVLDAHVGYGPVTVAAAGSLQLERHVTTDLVATIDGDGDGLPYVGQVLRGLRVGGVMTLAGVDEHLASSGIAYGDARDGRFDALFNVDGNGTGFVGPIAVQRNDGASIYARLAVDRRNNDVAGVVDARKFSLLRSLAPHLPGLDPARIPSLAGTLDAHLVGIVTAGRLTAANGALHVTSPGAQIDALANSDTGAVAVDGRIRGSFDRLPSPLASLGLRGGVDAPVRAFFDGTTTVVQLPGVRFTRASFRGIPLSGGSATVSLHDGLADVRAARLDLAGGSVVATGRFGANGELHATASGIQLRSLAGMGLPFSSGRLVANLDASGTPDSPRADIGLVVEGGRARGVDVAANAFAHVENRQLTLTDATVLAARSYAGASGTIRNLMGRGTPQLDVTASVHGAQIAVLAGVVPLRYPDGELDADLHATGALNDPRIAGDVRIPLGSINGLYFRDARVALSGGMTSLAARAGTVTVGSTVIAFSGDLGRAVQSVALRAPQTNLADFNDYFDAGDTLAGRGRIALAARLSGGAIGTSGDLAFAGAQVRRVPVGNVTARWQSSGRTIAGRADVNGEHGIVHVAGSIAFPPDGPLRDPLHRVAIDGSAQIAGLDLKTWLPLTGLQLPVTGRLDASVQAHGSPAAPQFAATASVRNAIAGGYAIDALDVAASGDGNGARITSADLRGPGLTAGASGTFGYGANAPIALALHAQTSDVALLAKGFAVTTPIHGTAVTDIRVSGTRADPRLAQTLDATNLQSGKFVLGHAHAELTADRQTLRLQQAEADFAHGKLTATASVPIVLAPPNLGLRDAPFDAALRADGVDLAQFDPLFPSDWKVKGRLDGQLTAGGSVRDPVLGGSLALAGGSYASSFVRSALTNVRMRLDLARSEARMTGVHADLGGGAIDGEATATFGDLRDIRQTLAFDGHVAIENAGLDLNNLIRGKVNGNLRARKARGAIPLASGTVAFSQTRIPLNALLPGKSGGSAPEPFPVAFDLNVQAGSDVRVQSANVDVGARGAVAVHGTLAKPVLDGSVTSTDGTLSFYRTFVLQPSRVAFRPDDGIVPIVDATATTHIPDPSTDVLLHVTGPATQLNLQLASNPDYDRAQILGLLVNAQAIGAVPGVASAQGSGGAPSISGLAGGYLSGAFTRTLLQPIGGQVGNALGLEDLSLGYDFNNGFSAGATRALGKNLTVAVNQSFGADQRQSLAIAHPMGNAASMQFTLYDSGQTSPTIGSTTSLFAPTGPTNFTLQALAPPAGSSGYVFSYQRKFR